MIAFGLYHLVVPVQCTTCGHYTPGATLRVKDKQAPQCPACGAETLKVASWNDVVILPKTEA